MHVQLGLLTWIVALTATTAKKDSPVNGTSSPVFRLMSDS
jgi:hypothetical protein